MADSGKKQSLTVKAAKGITWLSLSSSSGYVVALVTLVVLARLLSPAEFGIVSLALSFLGLAQLFSEVAMAPALLRRKEITDAHINVAFTTVIALSVVAATLMVIMAPWVSDYFRAVELRHMLWVIAILIPVNSVSSISQALLSRRGEFRLMAMINIPGLVIGYGATSIALAALGFGAWSLVIGTLVQQVLASILRFFSAKHSLALKWNVQAFNDLFHYGAGQTLSGWLNYIAKNADHFIVGRVLGLAAVGFYGRAVKLLSLPVELVSTATYTVVFPMASSVQDDAQRVKRAYARVLSVLVSILAPLSVFVIFAAKPIVLILLGSNWLPLVPVMQVLFVSLTFKAAYRHVNLPIQIKGSSYTVAVFSAAYAALVVIGSIVAATVGGTIVAVAIACGLAVFAHYLLCAWSANQLVSHSWLEFLRLHVPGLASSAALAIGLFPLRYASWVGDNAFVDLLTYIVAATLVLAASYFFAPKLFLGAENLGVFSRIVNLVPIIGGRISRWMESVVHASAPQPHAQ